jgi:hypothetical protein
MICTEKNSLSIGSLPKKVSFQTKSNPWNDMRFLHVEDAEHIENYTVRLEFNDGTHGIVDLSNSLDGPIFEPLKNLACRRGQA